MCFTGQLSAHSSTEGVQNIGLSEAAQNAENSSAVLPPAAGKFTADIGQPGHCKATVRLCPALNQT